MGYVTFTCSFDGRWDGLTVRAVFTNGDISRSVAVTPGVQYLIPYETLKKGRLYASFIGTSANGEMKLTTAKMLFPLIVLEAGAQDGTESQPYSSVFREQINDLIAAYLDELDADNVSY